MKEIKKLNPVSFFETLEPNPEMDAWIMQREKELAVQAEKEAAYQMQKSVESSGVPRRYWHVDFDTYIPRNEEDSKNLESIKNFANLENLNVTACIECGSCSYVCPAGRPLTAAMRTGKFELRRLQNAK